FAGVCGGTVEQRCGCGAELPKGNRPQRAASGKICLSPCKPERLLQPHRRFRKSPRLCAESAGTRRQIRCRLVSESASRGAHEPTSSCRRFAESCHHFELTLVFLLLRAFRNLPQTR